MARIPYDDNDRKLVSRRANAKALFPLIVVGELGLAAISYAMAHMKDLANCFDGLKKECLKRIGLFTSQCCKWIMRSLLRKLIWSIHTGR
jgi:hypothetical protein